MQIYANEAVRCIGHMTTDDGGMSNVHRGYL